MIGAAGQGLPQGVLVVEDDDGDALLVEAMLEDTFGGGVPVRRTVTLAETVAWFGAAARPDGWCALVDLALSDARGLEIVDAIRAVAPDEPVVVLTGDIDETQGLRAMAAGAQDYLVKGRVDPQQLRRSIAYAVERCRADEGARLLLREALLREENARLERGLLPTPILEHRAGLSWAATYRPGSDRLRLGGDFYDLVEAGDIVHVVIGDVCGHGPDEAALGVVMRVAWRALTRAGLAPAAVFSQLDDLMALEATEPAQFTTAASIRLLGDGQVGIVLAGHPAPVSVGPDGARCLDVAPGPPLGLGIGAGWHEHLVDVGEGDWLVGYTDGLIESRAPASGTLRLEAEDLLAAATEAWDPGHRGQALLDHFLGAVHRRLGGTSEDDLAVIGVELGGRR